VNRKNSAANAANGGGERKKKEVLCRTVRLEKQGGHTLYPFLKPGKRKSESLPSFPVNREKGLEDEIVDIVLQDTSLDKEKRRRQALFGLKRRHLAP